jgi:hypothetical protein
MNKKAIAKQLAKNWLLTFCINCVLMPLTMLIAFSKMTGSIEGNSGIILLMIASIVWCFTLSMASLTVFLNLYPSVSNSMLLSILSFFLLPGLATTAVYATFNYPEIQQCFFACTGLYFLTHSYFYISFRQAITNKQTSKRSL